jgi:FecR protein
VSDEYLWERSGPPDPEVQRLEQLLRPLQHVPAPVPDVRRRRVLIAAAAVATAVAAAVILWPRPPRSAGWAATVLSGAPRIGATAVARQATLGVGQWLETDPQSRAEVAVGSIGRVEVAPRTRVRLVDDGRTSHRIELARGTIEAFIWAPPGRFLVDVPGGSAVDLGCAYTLTVDDRGEGLLRVKSGWVGFDHQGRESFVPAGAACRTRPGLGPGTPYRLDAPAALPDALARFDFERDEKVRTSSLAVVLATATTEDAFTLWHLLARVAPVDRGLVFERLAALRPPPPGVSRAAIEADDRGARDLWWDALNLGPVQHWRRWKLERAPIPR